MSKNGVKIAKALLERKIIVAPNIATCAKEVVRIDDVVRRALRSFVQHNDSDFKVAEVVNVGDLEIGIGDTPRKVLLETSAAMDSGEVTQAIGNDILFKGTNGVWYTIALESRIVPADPKWVRDALAGRDDAEQQG